ncbi:MULTISPECIES: SCP2 sterol-binding domain-containing protein [Paenibacillus]|uniref:SCP2 sterol-binding domain-containing protein n=1 Tax=Paenibacillus TaxID=44249 RepID=UPI0022B87140|nr:SCP2 sterol-binding domain-containing protein [Paenibacillus caseinilyticus]MCZ8518613.1 SCP2 sterol-binding domain-containing protein [Paenibacillus caseinilyticus]
MSARDELHRIKERMEAYLDPIRDMHYVYEFRMDDSGPLQVRFEGGRVDILEEAAYPSDCTLILSDGHLVKLLRGDLNTTMAFMLGQLKVEGKMGLALKLQERLKSYV